MAAAPPGLDQKPDLDSATAYRRKDAASIDNCRFRAGKDMKRLPDTARSGEKRVPVEPLFS